MIKRIRVISVFFVVLFLCFSILLLFAMKQHAAELEESLTVYAQTDKYYNITVTDRNGAEIYDAGFSDSKNVRLSTFHIVGDRYGSIPASVLSSESRIPLTISKLSGYTPQADKVQLTIDLRLQTGAYEMLSEHGCRGAAVVLDYTTGEVVAMVSTPSVDVYYPEKCEDGAYLCKATSAYTPGSTMKTIAAAAVLEKNSDAAKDFRYTCGGTDGHVCCYGNGVHGEEGLTEILQNSCNCGMARAAKTLLTPDDLQTFARSTHIFSSTLFLDYACAAGNLNAADDLAWSACGQSQDLLTPIGVASFYAALANDGRIWYPHILSDTAPESDEILSESTADYLAGALAQVAANAGVQCKAFGKTGTAELDGGALPHSWFACSLTDSNAPTYTVVFFLENGGASTQAKDLLAAYVNTYLLGGDAE